MKIIKIIFSLLSLLAIAPEASAILATEYFKNQKDNKRFLKAPTLLLTYNLQNYHPAFSCCAKKVGGEIQRLDWCETPTKEQLAAPAEKHYFIYPDPKKISIPSAKDTSPVYAPGYRCPYVRPDSYYTSTKQPKNNQRVFEVRDASRQKLTHSRVFTGMVRLNCFFVNLYTKFFNIKK